MTRQLIKFQGHKDPQYRIFTEGSNVNNIKKERESNCSLQTRTKYKNSHFNKINILISF